MAASFKEKQIMKYWRNKAIIKAMLPSFDKTFEVGDDEFQFNDIDNLRASFICVSDTHFRGYKCDVPNFNNIFIDINKNSPVKFNGLIMTGDITEMSTSESYEKFFGVLDKYKNDLKVMVTIGNHDSRRNFNVSKKIIMDRTEKYLDIKTNGKTYYSYDLNGYTFIALSTESNTFEQAYISNEQMTFLDMELKRGTKNDKPVFILCHQSFKNTHNLPDVWRTGDMGKQSDQVRAIMEKYKNVFFINGHLHGGIYEKTFEILNKKNNVYSLSLPCYGKENNFGIRDRGMGFYCEVYDDKVIFTARNFLKGQSYSGDFTKFEIKLI